MLLSIVLMIKNEETYLDNTLKALNILRENINSELIILDTGSTDKSIEIARNYTDKVYFSNWNDNFAEMRNKSISYSKGDWILILDADEELIESKKIIDFFNSNLHKEFNCASVELNNINSEDYKSFTKSINLRLFKNDNFGYEGAIHEQPIHKGPMYNNVAIFNHYGYLYTDEEHKQAKIKRNETILLKVLKDNPDDPYMNFQLAKNFMAVDNNEEARYYMEKSMNLHTKLRNIPPYVQSNLAKLYILLSEFKKCEDVCSKYLKNDSKNIDIYYYLGISQKMLNKYEKSLISYNKYMLLLENYKTSTQANSIFCDGNTVDLKEHAELDMIKIYYEMQKYEEVINKIENINLEQFKSIYKIIIISLYKTDRLDEILCIYKTKLTSYREKKHFIVNVEETIFKLRYDDRKTIYKMLSEIDGNYGILNKVRLGLELSIEEYNKILIEENDNYYGDLIYYSLKQNLDLINILDGVNCLNIENYIKYLVQNKKSIVLDMCTYLINLSNTLNINRLNVISCIAKNILKNICLTSDKYKMLFMMYITYEYECIKYKYNSKFSDEQILKYIKDEDERFVINMNLAQKQKNNDKLQYIKSIKQILIGNPIYKKGLEIIIDEFKKEINENNEIKYLKDKFRSIIKKYLNNESVLEADKQIIEYKDIFGIDAEIINLNAILEMIKCNFINAEKLLKQAYLLDKNNYDVIFNIACIKEILGQYKEAVDFLNYIIVNCNNEDIVFESKEKIRNIKESRM